MKQWALHKLNESIKYLHRGHPWSAACQSRTQSTWPHKGSCTAWELRLPERFEAHSLHQPKVQNHIKIVLKHRLISFYLFDCNDLSCASVNGLVDRPVAARARHGQHVQVIIQWTLALAQHFSILILKEENDPLSIYMLPRNLLWMHPTAHNSS